MLVKIRKVESLKDINIPKYLIGRFLKNKVIPKIKHKGTKVFRIPINEKEESYLAIVSGYPNTYLFYINDSPIRKRIENEIKTEVEIDKALFTIFSIVIDNYMKILESVSKQMKAIREKILEEGSIHMKEISKLFDKLDFLQDSIITLQSNITEAIENKELLEILIYEIHGIGDMIHDLNGKIKLLLDLHSDINNRFLNEKMEKLTVLSTIFLPATLIASIYGMNFQLDVFPSWAHPYGFTIAMTSIVLSSIIVYLLLKRIK